MEQAIQDLAREIARQQVYACAYYANGGINPEFTMEENRDLTHLMFRELWQENA